MKSLAITLVFFECVFEDLFDWGLFGKIYSWMSRF